VDLARNKICSSQRLTQIISRFLLVNALKSSQFAGILVFKYGHK
jgi:hypothetical protein